MNIPQCEQWARETQAILQRVDQLQAEIDQLNGYMEIATARQDLQHLSQFTTQRDHRIVERDETLAVLSAKTSRDDAEGARTLLIDLDHRITGAREAYAEWRRRVQQFEFLVANEPTFDRPQAEAQLTRERNRVDAWTQQVDALVPASGHTLRAAPVVLLHG